METAMYKAAMEGNVDFLREVRDLEIETGCWNKHFLGSLTPQENNIIHVASQYDRYDFLKSGFNFFNFSPLMIAKRNANGDTPLHVASKRGNLKVVKLLVDASKFVLGEVSISKEPTREINEAAEEEGDDHPEEEMPWRIKNKEGNTPLHEALTNGKLHVATYLLKVDPQLGNVVNDARETPLHLAIKYNVDGDKKLAIDTIEFLNKQRASLPCRGLWLPKESLSMIELLLEKQNKDVYVRDDEGLTPLLRAAAQSHFRAIEVILNKHPECLEMCDLEGKTIMHLIKFQTYEEVKNFLSKNPQILNLKDQQDKKGNTPAHIAVMNCIKKFSNKRNVFDEDHECGVWMKFQSYKEATKFAKMPQLCSLKGEQDEGEDISASPIVAMNCMKNIKEEQNILINDGIVGVIRAMFELQTNFTIKNKEGVSAATLFQRLKPHFSCDEPLLTLDMEIEKLLTEHKFKRKEEKCFWKAVEDQNVDRLRQDLVKLEVCLKDRLISITDLFHKLLQVREAKHGIDENNPIKNCCDKLMRRGDRHENATSSGTCHYEEVEKLMQELFEKNPLLMYETNSRGDTPLHMMVRVRGHKISDSLLYQMKFHENADQDEVYCPPWRVKNIEGNTPLHEALLHITPNNDGRIIKFLFECDPDIFQKSDSDLDIDSYLNDRNETPLHVFCRSEGKFTNEVLIKEIIEANKWACLHGDVEGLNPLLRAAKNGKIDIIKQMWEISPESAEVRDCKGRTFWHILDMSHTTRGEESVLKKALEGKEKLIALSSAKDTARTTPLLQAIKSHNYDLAQFLSRITSKSVSDVINEERIGTLYTLFVLLFANFLPRKLEVILWNRLKNVGVKSFYGVPRSEIKDYTNTMGVIAVLLATIAFTGAFAVPGGFDQNDGYPVLLKFDRHLKDDKYVDQVIRIGAYWVFMVMDILTMCLSMMVLFCIQWIITGDDKDKLVITDLSIMLLNTAFRTTMVALMMGVFACTYEKSATMAILTLIMCSTLLLLLQRTTVVHSLQYVFLTVYLTGEMLTSFFVGKEKMGLKENKSKE